MAFFDLLKASYNGKLGETVGANYKGIPTVRSRTWSKAPASNIQTGALRAFECLNRLASALARVAWPYLGLLAVKMHPHNAIARWLKVLISEKTFDISRLKDVIPQSEKITITTFILDVNLRTLSLRVDVASGYAPAPGETLIVIVLDDLGRVYHEYAGPLETYQVNTGVALLDLRIYNVVAFTSHRVNGKAILDGLKIGADEIVQYSLTEQMTNERWLDGRPIYRQTFQVTPNASTAAYGTYVQIPLPGIFMMIRYEALFEDVTQWTRQYYGPLPGWSGTNTNLLPWAVDVTMQSEDYSIYVYFSVPDEDGVNAINSKTLYLTVWYTKQSDQPS